MRHDTRAAEMGVLGSMLRDNAVIADVLLVVRREHFYADAHQRVFDAIIDLSEKGHPADAVTVADALKAHGNVENVGGYAYLGELWEAAPSAAYAEHYAKIVRSAATLRDLARAGGEIQREAEHPTGPAEQVLEDAEKRIFAIAQMGIHGQAATAAECADEFADWVDAMTVGRPGGLVTGLTDLDGLTAGLQNSELTIVAARPGGGKTAFALELVRQVALEQGLPVYVASLEMNRLELTGRLVCSMARVNSQHLRKSCLTKQEANNLADALARFRASAVLIDDRPNQSMLHIAAGARRMKLKQGLRLLVIDYLQLIEPDNRREPRHEQVAGISRRLKLLARELTVPVVCLAQLNRASEESQRPRLSHLRESGGIESDADVVILMHRPDEHEDVIELIVAKQRNGPVGDLKLTYLRQFGRFENRAAIPESWSAQT